MRRLFGGGVAVADGVGIFAPVGVFAMTVLAEMAPLAFTTTDVVLDENQVAFAEALAAREFAAGLGDVTDVLVAHDHGAWRRRSLVELDVGSANARDFHFEQSAIGGNLGHGKFANFSFAWAYPNGR